MTRGIRGIVLSIMLAVAAVSAAAAEEEAAPRWGVGWLGMDSAPTVRLRLGDWQIGLAARPNDDLNYVEKWEWSSYEAEPDSVRDVWDDDKRESGWVRLDVARTMARWDKVELPLLVAVSYGWSDQQYSSSRWDEQDEGFTDYLEKYYTNSYSVTLAVRPTWYIRPWVSLELEFGVRYLWDNYDYDARRTDPDWEQDDLDWRRGHGKSFVKYGPERTMSVGMFNLVFWF